VFLFVLRWFLQACAIHMLVLQWESKAEVRGGLGRVRRQTQGQAHRTISEQHADRCSFLRWAHGCEVATAGVAESHGRGEPLQRAMARAGSLLAAPTGIIVS
jgi:hypothetical protein